MRPARIGFSEGHGRGTKEQSMEGTHHIGVTCVSCLAIGDVSCWCDTAAGVSWVVNGSCEKGREWRVASCEKGPLVSRVEAEHART